MKKPKSRWYFSRFRCYFPYIRWDFDWIWQNLIESGEIFVGFVFFPPFSRRPESNRPACHPLMFWTTRLDYSNGSAAGFFFLHPISTSRFWVRHKLDPWTTLVVLIRKWNKSYRTLPKKKNRTEQLSSQYSLKKTTQRRTRRSKDMISVHRRQRRINIQSSPPVFWV